MCEDRIEAIIKASIAHFKEVFFTFISSFSSLPVLSITIIFIMWHLTKTLGLLHWQPCKGTSQAWMGLLKYSGSQLSYRCSPLPFWCSRSFPECALGIAQWDLVRWPFDRLSVCGLFSLLTQLLEQMPLAQITGKNALQMNQMWWGCCSLEGWVHGNP